jgi:nicotinamide-nucleotide amidase
MSAFFYFAHNSHKKIMLRIALVTIGDEILIGQIINTNAAWISSKFTQLGAEMFYHSTIGDERDALRDKLDRLRGNADLIVLTGGLGPTHDDITKPVLVEYFNDETELNEEILEYLKDFFEQRGIEFSERNREQAMLPKKCRPLENRVGTAPGMLFEENDMRVLSLPGVPAEMKYIMKNDAIDYVKRLMEKEKHDVALYRTIRTSGIPESKLADLVGDPEKIPGNVSLAFLPSYRGVRMRIGVKDENREKAIKRLDKAENRLRDIAGKFIYGSGEKDLTQSVGDLLIEKNKTLSVAESCTSGMLGAAITEAAGSSEYFTGGVMTYSNEAKMQLLDVQEQTLIDHGAVSEETAMQMASGVRNRFDTDFGIGITGIAGPTGGTKEKPVGTVWIGISFEEKTYAIRYNFGNDRDVNRERSVGMALNMLLDELRG